MARDEQAIPDVARILRVAENLEPVFAGVARARHAAVKPVYADALRPVVRYAVEHVVRQVLQYSLGARPLQVLATVFKRPLIQIALGIGVGATLGFALANDDLSEVHLDDFGMTAVFALWTILCCALASIVPTRRALRIQPTEALRDEG